MAACARCRCNSRSSNSPARAPVAARRLTSNCSPNCSATGLIIANATGCSSIYGGNLPTTPYTKNADGRGPAWANSLFEDNAEFGLGFRVSLDKQQQFAGELLHRLSPQVGRMLATEILNARQRDEADICEQRERVAELKRKLESLRDPYAKRLLALADTLVRKSVWIVGGDGWGYDIGYGGLDHVLASGRNVKVLLLDTEVYSNTGGQCSKSTPRGAVAKFASGGKRAPKKDLGLMAMTYGTIYVASVAMGAKDEHTLEGVPRSRSLRRAGADHRLQPLHRSRHQHDDRDAKPEGGGELRAVAPLSLQSRARARSEKIRSSSIRPRRARRWRITSSSRTASRCSTRPIPRAAKELLDHAQADANARRTFYEFLAAQKSQPRTSNHEPNDHLPRI